jgi:DNA-binding protein
MRVEVYSMAVAEEPKMEENVEKTEEKPKDKKAEDNVIFVGKKPTMSYVLAAITQFSDGQKEIHIKARGRSISRAVDVAEAIKNKFVQDIKRAVEIGTEEVQDKERENLRVSTIDITLKK